MMLEFAMKSSTSRDSPRAILAMLTFPGDVSRVMTESSNEPEHDQGGHAPTGAWAMLKAE